MNPPRADQASAERDLLLLLGEGQVGRSRDREVAFSIPTDSDRQPSMLTSESAVDVSGSGHHLGEVSTSGELRPQIWEDYLSVGADESVTEVSAEPEVDTAVRALYYAVADVFRNESQLAELLRVPEDRIREWKQGVVSDEEVSDRLENLAVAVTKLRAVYESEVIPDWLQALNGHLGGARPIDVLVRGQLSRVIAAIEAERGGAHT